MVCSPVRRYALNGASAPWVSEPKGAERHGRLIIHEGLERHCQAFHPEVEPVSVMPIDVTREATAPTCNETFGFFAEPRYLLSRNLTSAF